TTPRPPRRLTLRALAWHPRCREPAARRGPPSHERRAMFSHAIMLAILTHPLHVLLFGVILSRLAREMVSAAARAREAARVGSGRRSRWVRRASGPRRWPSSRALEAAAPASLSATGPRRSVGRQRRPTIWASQDLAISWRVAMWLPRESPPFRDFLGGPRIAQSQERALGMLKIQRSADAGHVRVALSGHIEKQHLAELQRVIEED